MLGYSYLAKEPRLFGPLVCQHAELTVTLQMKSKCPAGIQSRLAAASAAKNAAAKTIGRHVVPLNVV